MRLGTGILRRLDVRLLEVPRLTIHGGDIWQVGSETGIPPEDLLDFSANINPRGLPPAARERLARDASDPCLLRCYPDPSARSLREALSCKLDVPADAIAVGPGAEALLAPILRSLNVRRALVPVPAFSEYRRVCDREQISFLPLPLSRSNFFGLPAHELSSRVEADQPDIVILNNPHNPSGALLDFDVTRAAASPLLLDEAFIDYVPGASLVREAAASRNLFVLRSLTKFYGCPALRVGYAIAHPDAIRRIRTFLPTWSVTQLAMDALSQALYDREFDQVSRRENAASREQLAHSLSRLGLTVFPSAANYLLIELQTNMPHSAELRIRLIAHHKILIRNCDSYENLTPGRYFRVAVRTTDENCRLSSALAEELRLP